MVHKGWKLFRATKNGPRSLFIDRTRPLPENRWPQSLAKPTKGFAERPGWHVMTQPEAPHLSLKNRVWQKVEATIVWDGAKPEWAGHSKGLLK